jgi:hypothetical protein
MSLLPFDTLLHNVGAPAVSTITWMSGECENIVPFVKQRMNAILQSNPWLAGRIVKSKDQKLVLRYPTKISSNQGEEFLVQISASESPFRAKTTLMRNSLSSCPRLTHWAEHRRTTVFCPC